jgi:hypothetical protein
MITSTIMVSDQRLGTLVSVDRKTVQGHSMSTAFALGVPERAFHVAFAAGNGMKAEIQPSRIGPDTRRLQ